jgi:hypothetical protein
LGGTGTIIGWVAIGAAAVLFVLLALTVALRLREKDGG